MMLNGSYLGVSFFEAISPSIVPNSYNKLEFLGECILDKLWIKKGTLTEEEFESFTLETYKPIWDSDTLMLGNFDHTLNTGNVKMLDSLLTQYDIHRKQQGSSLLKKIATVDKTITEYIDYTASQDGQYSYYVTPRTETEIGEQLKTSLITPQYYGSYFIDTNTLEVHKFELNRQPSTYRNVSEVGRFNTFNRVPTIVTGTSDYMTGHVSAIMGNVDNNIIKQDTHAINQLREFINNGNQKIYKDDKGFVWLVNTMNFEIQELHPGISSHPYSVSFNFEESGDV